MPAMTWREMQGLNRDEVVILNLHYKDECAMKMIPGAVNIPVDGCVADSIASRPINPILICCAIGARIPYYENSRLANGCHSVKIYQAVARPTLRR